jgi:hypothetical protein
MKRIQRERRYTIKELHSRAKKRKARLAKNKGKNSHNIKKNKAEKKNKGDMFKERKPPYPASE